jgi:gamma-glutamyltranspeptidase
MSFACQKQPASGSRGMVVSNHPLASAAGAEMLAAGGNAIDAAIATLFTLTVVEPMMVGIIGGGMAHIRLADGSHRFVDGQSTVPLAVKPDTPLGDVLADYMIRADYRGWAILGPPPPAASGVHIAQMLNILGGYDIAAKGFGTAETIHLLAEVLKIAFADRAAASGDPDFVGVPVERLTSKDYANERRRAIDPNCAQKWGAGVAQLESAHTTHMTAADAMGNAVATTQTINNLFGAKILNRPFPIVCGRRSQRWATEWS